MPIYECRLEGLRRIAETDMATSGLRERQDLQRLLREQIGVVAPDTMVVAEEFGDWEDSSRRIDLLGIDREGNLVVIELKRTNDGGHMELQALRYAAMVSTMTFNQVVAAHTRYLLQRGRGDDAREAILSFLEWEGPDDERFGQDVRIVLVAGDFSKEITTAVLWLNSRGLDIRCVRLKSHLLDGRILLDVQQVLPLPEAHEYQVRVREKEERERAARGSTWDYESFLKSLRDSRGDSLVRLAQEIHDVVAGEATYFFWGRGAEFAGMVPIIKRDGVKYYLFKLRSDGRMAIWFSYLKGKGPFADSSLLEELRKRLNAIAGVELPAPSGKPAFDFACLEDPNALAAFKGAWGWFVDRIRNMPADARPTVATL